MTFFNTVHRSLKTSLLALRRRIRGRKVKRGGNALPVKIAHKKKRGLKQMVKSCVKGRRTRVI